jgi:O-antigen/teichoic acid export membrane protein
MSRQHYLLKVLGLSAVPKLVTFALTLVAFPLMVRAVGAAEYGVVVYFTSIIVLFDAVAAGVTAATGKAIASARVLAPGAIGAVLRRWMTLLAVVSLGVLPLAAIGGGLFIVWAGYDRAALEVYVLLALGSWLSLGATFARVVLASLLQFGRVAVLDTAESVLRSASWLVVAWMAPTALGLAVTGLVVAVVVLGLCVPFLRSSVRARAAAAPEGAPPATLAGESVRERLSESMQFVGVNLATRAFQALPIIVIDRLLGAEVVGILGAFARVIELVSLPLAIIANALAVRAQEVVTKGRAALERYWHVLARTAVVGALAAGAFWFVADEVARVMLPQSGSAAVLFQWMALLLVARSTADLFAPASDYIGGLGRRVVFLACCSVAQVPLIWLGAVRLGEVGAVVGVVGAYVLTVAGYVVIARRAFFGSDPAPLPHDLPLALALAVASLAVGVVLAGPLAALLSAASIPLAPSLAALLLYLAVLGAAFIAAPSLRRLYPTLRFLELD